MVPDAIFQGGEGGEWYRRGRLVLIADIMWVFCHSHYILSKRGQSGVSLEDSTRPSYLTLLTAIVVYVLGMYNFEP